MDIISGGNSSLVIDDIIDGNAPVDGDRIDGNDAPFQAIAVPAPFDTRRVWLESLDGTVILPLTDEDDDRRVLLTGVQGMELPPVDVIRTTNPFIAGSTIREVNVLEREIFLPMRFETRSSQVEFLNLLAELRGVVWPGFSVGVGALGTFRLCVSSPVGDRVIDVTYLEGWEGDWSTDAAGEDFERFGLRLLAVDPFFRNRDYTETVYQVDNSGEVFLSDSDDDAWPRALSASVVIGNGMLMRVEGDVPVWMEMVVNGPAASAGVTFPGTNAQVPGGVAAGSELVLITDPRGRSARLDGAVGWDRIAMGATFAPLQPGVNTVNVALLSGGDGTALTVRWREGWLSAW